MITEMDPNRFATYSLRDPRILRILSAALEAVDPYVAVQKNLPELEGRVFGLGIGKAAIPMMDALARRIPLSGGLAVTKFALGLSRESFAVIEGGHPIPDARSLYAGEQVLEFVSSLNKDDTLVCMISGGGSALVAAPYVPLEDLQKLTALLLSSGAPIDEINTLRRQLDRIKGGGLALSTKAKIVSLILSDVIGNPLEAIASGPTVPNPTTQEEANAILKKHGLEEQVPNSVYVTLREQSDRGVSDSEYENLPPAPLAGASVASPGVTDPFSRVQNIIIGDNRLAAQAALNQAQNEGFYAEILTNELQGEAREIGKMLTGRLRDELIKLPPPFCLIAGGETTVTLKGHGKGGRNQELALAAVNELAGLENAMLVSLATDGDDGPTDAAGAVVTGESDRRAASLGLDAAGHLSQNDAYPFFQALGDLLMTGPTGTNVNDLIFLIAG